MHVYSTDLFLKLTFANYVYFKVSHCKNLSNSSDIYHWESQYSRSNLFYNTAYSNDPRIFVVVFCVFHFLFILKILSHIFINLFVWKKK